MKEKSKSLKLILNMVAFAAFELLSILLGQTSVLAAQPQIANGGRHSVGLKSNGTVTAVGWNYYGQLNVDSWSDIVQVAAAVYHTIGLKSNGVVVAVGTNYYGQLNVSDWTDIVQVATSGRHTLGVRSDGTVAVAGCEAGSDYGQCDVSSWSDIVQVAAGVYHSVGLKSDGTLVAVGGNQYGQCDVYNWTNIEQVAAGNKHTVGIKYNTMVVATGDNDEGQCNVSGWSNIRQVAAGEYHTVGLKSDGTVVAVGGNQYGQCDVGSWYDIVQISLGHDANHTLGLKSDGTVLAVGWNYFNQCDVADWNLDATCILHNKFQETTITKSMPYYTDRSYKLTSVPDYYKNLPMIKTPNDDRTNKKQSGYLTFRAEYDTSVYVAFDQRATDLPDWMDDFVPTGDILGTSLLTQRYLKLFTKFYLEGECIDLGGNYGLGSSSEYRSNYIVIYEPFDLCALDPQFNEVTVTNGIKYYTDRDYRITGGIPSWMLGRTLIQTPNDERTNTSASGYLSLNSPVRWWVYVLFDSRSVSVPNWLNGWERYTKYPDIQTSLATQPSLKMYRKMFDAGECVNLGGNYGPGSSGEYRSNYAVVYGK